MHSVSNNPESFAVIIIVINLIHSNRPCNHPFINSVSRLVGRSVVWSVVGPGQSVGLPLGQSVGRLVGQLTY